MRILVIGAGATGGYYGGRLALAGRDVTFLVRDRRAAELRRTGLILRTPGGEHRLEPRLVSAEELASAGPFDLILLSVKAYALEPSINDFAPAVGPQTMVLPVLNGMRHLDVLEQRFGAERVLGGTCRIVADLDPDGAVRQMTSLNDLAYGERARTVTPRIKALDAQMQGADFRAVLAPDILATMWVKWMLMASTGTINVLGRGSIGAIAAVDALENVGLRFENRVVDEAFACAAAHGYPPDDAAAKLVRERLTEPGSSFEASMFRDLKRGYPVEADQIIGDFVRRARLHKVDTPLMEAAYVQLSAYMRTRSAAPGA